MSELSSAIKLLDSIITHHDARTVITNENGDAGESFLLATRDGYLNFAKAILKTVEAYDESRKENPYWNGEVSFTLNQLPNDTPSLTGSYVYKDHASLIDGIIEWTSWDANIELIKNDPDFNEPSN